jgi:hypothetical protein
MREDRIKENKISTKKEKEGKGGNRAEDKQGGVVNEKR